MKKLSLVSIIISIFAFTLLLTGVFGLPSNDASSNSNSSSIQWIYDYGLSGLVLTDLKYTKSDSEIVVTGTIKNNDPDFTKLAVALKLNLYGNNSQTLGILNVDPEGMLIPEEQKASFVRVDPGGILKPNQTTNFVVKYTSPEAASNLHRIYAQFYSDNCGTGIRNNMGCFGQTINVTKVDPQTNLPIK